MIIDLNLSGKLVIVIGGGMEGIRKVKALLDQKCEIIVISNRLNKFFSQLSENKQIQIIKTKKLTDANILDNYTNIFVVIAATDDKNLNRKFVQKAKLMGAFAYSVDDPSFSDFSYASIINIKGIMQIGISTSGKSPIMARRIRIKAERILKRIIKDEDIENAKLQEFARIAAKPIIKSVAERKRFLYTIINDKGIQNFIRNNKIEDAKLAIIDLLNNWEIRSCK